MNHTAINTLHTDLFGDDPIKTGHLWNEQPESRAPELLSVVADAALKMQKTHFQGPLPAYYGGGGL